MASNRVEGVQSYKSRGKLYHYHRKSGKRLREPYGSTAFLLEVDALDRKEAVKASAGSLRTLIEAYKKTDGWTGLAPKTQLSYERAFAAMKPIHDRPLKEFSPPFVAAYRDAVNRTRRRWMANYVLTLMVLLFDLAREKGWVAENPAKDVRRVRPPRDAVQANRRWTRAECQVVLQEAPLHLRTPIALAMFTGMRKADVLEVRWSDIVTRTVDVDGVPTIVRALVRVTSKRKQEVAFPIAAELAALLPPAPADRSRPIAITSRHEAWTESGFNSTFGKFVDRLEAAGKVAPGLTFHGLRHTMGDSLREVGASKDLRKRLLGHTSDAMADHYSRSADVTGEAVKIVEKMRITG